MLIGLSDVRAFVYIFNARFVSRLFLFSCRANRNPKEFEMFLIIKLTVLHHGFPNPFFFGKEPHPLLWAVFAGSRGKITEVV
jgi:hypothetical protein